MAGQGRATGWRKRLVKRIACPSCWHEFPPEDVMYISRSGDLRGDPVLGADEFRRFRPVHFTVAGEAVDNRGIATTLLACPRCHLPIHELLAEVPPLFISLIGPPASGKSYFLATMVYGLRTNVLPAAGLRLQDADPAANSIIRDYEDILFSNPQPDKPTEIPKTDPTSPQLYRRATIDGMEVRFPLPFQFSIWPTEEHPSYAEAERIGRVLVLYDNAGEDFLPGSSELNSEAVRHLAQSDILLMMFDPTQEMRLHEFCKSGDPQVAHGIHPDGRGPVIARQETILTEAAKRMRNYLHMSHTEPLGKPIIVVVPKFDALGDLPDVSIDVEPYVQARDDHLIRLDMPRVEEVSDNVRQFLKQKCPDFVATAESLSNMVRYIPVSSLGCSPVRVTDGDRRFYGVRPMDIRPKWVTVPMLYCMTRWADVILRQDSSK